MAKPLIIIFALEMRVAASVFTRASLALSRSWNYKSATAFDVLGDVGAVVSVPVPATAGFVRTHSLYHATIVPLFIVLVDGARPTWGDSVVCISCFSSVASARGNSQCPRAKRPCGRCPTLPILSLRLR